MFLLSVEKDKLQKWSKAKTKGKIPAPRYMHSMDYFKESNVIIIYGGRNDNLKNNNILGDMHVLYMDSLTW